MSQSEFVKARGLLLFLPSQFSQINTVHFFCTFFSSFLPKLPSVFLAASVLGAMSFSLLSPLMQHGRRTWMIYKQIEQKVLAPRSLQSNSWMWQPLSRGWDCCVHVLSTWKLWLKALSLQSALLVRNIFRPQSCNWLYWPGAQWLCRAWRQASPADRRIWCGPSLLGLVCYCCKSTYFLVCLFVCLCLCLFLFWATLLLLFAVLFAHRCKMFWLACFIANCAALAQEKISCSLPWAFCPSKDTGPGLW